MAEIKTKPNAASVEKFLNAVKDAQQREDSLILLEMMRKASKEEPKMWGASLIGFGQVRIKSPSGREVEWLRIGFSPRKGNFSIYISGDIVTQHGAALKTLGKHKTGKGCLYINRLEDVDLKVLKGMIDASLKRKDFFAK